MATETPTAGEKLAFQVAAYVKSRCAVLWIQTPEEGRAERSLIEPLKAAGYGIKFWDYTDGVTDVTGKPVGPGQDARDPGQMLGAIRDSRDREVWVLRDFPVWLDDPILRRNVRSLAKSLPKFRNEEARAIVILSPSATVHPDLGDHVILIKWPLPDRTEIARILDQLVGGLPEKFREGAVTPEVREAAIEAAVGLSGEAALKCYTQSIVTQGKKIVPAFVAAEKKRAVSGKGIDWFDADPRGLGAVGGLDYIKPWLTMRKLAFSEEAREFGLPPPKGMFLVGVAGCGKSLIAKAVATAFDIPLLKLDIGGMQSKWVGESQQNIRSGLAVVDAIGRCVLWVDEIEKALAGATSGAADGGVASDALGTFLTWMQERKSSVFVIATANDVTKLPPELLRKGRFDEMFFVDLPTRTERCEILSVTLKQFKRDPDTIDLDKVAMACVDFTGAEIAALLPDALFAAFADGKRVLTTADLLKTAASTVPLAKTAADKVKALRDWAKGKARPASKPETDNTTDTGGRSLDI